MVKGFRCVIILGASTMEIIYGVLHLGNRVSSFVVDGDKVEFPMDPSYVHEGLVYKSWTGTYDFTSATSAKESEPTCEGSYTEE